MKAHPDTNHLVTTGSVDPSHVLLAMGIAPELAHGSLRLTLGPETTVADVDRTVEVVASCIGRLRGLRTSEPVPA